MFDILRNKYFKFALAAVIYILWVIWIGSFWLLIGLGVVFDIYITGKINWSFWKKKEGPNNTFIEWLDALIFAVIAVTLINIFLFQNYRIPTGSMEKSLQIGDHLAVSKVAFGPRMPNTPIAFPFTQHTIPIIKTRSWSNLITAPYRRLKGFGDVKRFDVVVFNFPAGDTVVLENQAVAYEEILREHAYQIKAYESFGAPVTRSEADYMSLAREEVWNDNTIIYRPVDRRENYVKRCVGLPGDVISVKEGLLYVNDKAVEDNGTQQTTYFVKTNGTKINPRAFERLRISKSDQVMVSGNTYMIPLTKENAQNLANFANVTELWPDVRRNGDYASHIFPHNPRYVWNVDFFGPLWIPEKDATVKIDTGNISIYKRIIDVYEDNDLVINDSLILINGEVATSYTFKMNYYWMMGDNRHDSADSRYWGFVPEDHIVGKPKMIWLSIDKNGSGLKRIRFRRMFKRIR